MKKIIFICGKKRHGKDTVAIIVKELLEELGLTVDILALASPLKDILSESLGITASELNMYKDKGSCLTTVSGLNKGFDSIITYRGLLQKFGTDAMKKHFGDNVWSELHYKSINKSEADVIIVPDWRFKSELAFYIGNNNVDITTVKVFNPRGINKDEHISEIDLDDVKCKHHILNDSTLSDLRYKVNNMIIMENLYAD